MNDILNLSIIALAALTHATLQLSLGSLLLLYHDSSSRQSRRRTHRIVASFIIGAAIIIAIGTAAACFVIHNLIITTPATPESITIILSATIGLLIAAAIIMLTLYYRCGQSTELWLPKSFSRFIASRAHVTKNSTEAFSLGILTVFAELPFALILIAIAATTILELPVTYQIPTILIYATVTILPLIFLHLVLRTGKTLVEVQKWRIHNKTFLRILSASLFLVLGLFILTFKLLGVI